MSCNRIKTVFITGKKLRKSSYRQDYLLITFTQTSVGEFVEFQESQYSISNTRNRIAPRL